MRKMFNKWRMALFTVIFASIPSRLLAGITLPFDTTPESFQGSEKLVRFLNKVQTGGIIILTILFVISIVEIRANLKNSKGIKLACVGAALAVFGIVVLSNPAYWINLISSWVD